MNYNAFLDDSHNLLKINCLPRVRQCYFCRVLMSAKLSVNYTIRYVLTDAL
jgi:hypothetical protein